MEANVQLNSPSLSPASESRLKSLSLVLVFGSFFVGCWIKNPVFGYLFIFFVSFYQVARMYFYLFGALRWKFKLEKSVAAQIDSNPPLVSIIVPCYNEAAVIRKSLQSLDRSKYPHFEIIVSDDGSVDNTVEIVKSLIPECQHRVEVVTQKNAGKAHALNRGIRVARGEYLLCVDADSLLHPEALDKGVAHLQSDSSVVAVAGAVCVANSEKWIALYQDLEYGLGDLQKSFMSNFGLVNIIPGPVGLFRRSSLESVNGYETDAATFAEDTELTLRLITTGGRVVFEPKMISYTEVPERCSALMRQRYRWTRGIYQALRKNMDSLQGASFKHKNIFVSYLLMEKVWTPVMDFCLLMFFLGQFVASAKVNLFVGYNAMIFLSESLLLLCSGLLFRRGVLFQFIVLIFSRFTFSIIITTWKFFCLREEWQKTAMSWDKLDRYGLAPSKESLHADIY